MFIKPLSNLYLDLYENRNLTFTLPPSLYDNETILIIAGNISKNDISNYIETWSLQYFHVMIVMGTYDILTYSIQERQQYLNEFENRYDNVTVFDNTTKMIDDIVFTGGTLWSNMCDENSEIMNISQEKRIEYLESFFEEVISTEIGIDENGYFRLFSNKEKVILEPKHTIPLFYKTVSYITDILTKNEDKKTVVMTHHLPHRKSVPEIDASLLKYSYMTDLDNLIENLKPSIWIHGYSNNTKNYVKHKTTIISHSMGKYAHDLNIDYDPYFLLEI